MKKTYYFILFMSLFLSFSSTISSMAAVITSDKTNAIQTDILNLLNQNRVSNGLAPLLSDDNLTLISDTRVQEITRSFSHTRPDGRRYSTVFSDFHVGYRYCGEILAYGYQSPEQVINAWIESPGHHDTILSPRYTHVGISHLLSDNHLDYWAVTFLAQ